MGRLTRLLAALALATSLLALGASPAAGFTGFGSLDADSTYGVELVFGVDLEGGDPDRLELLLQIGGDEGTFVAPVPPSGGRGEYRWDAADRHLTPNTSITYRWRATDGDDVTLSPPGTLLYEDDRAGLDWQTLRIGDATVHWYGGAEATARRFGDLTAIGASQAEELLGHQLDGPIDIFVYDTREEFFGALGPGAREWTGAATYPDLRTVFMWLQGGSGSFLETTLVHEVTHVVFNDATANPFHEPPKWLNEGLAVWSERRSADAERATVEFEAAGAGLFSFEAISYQFPIGERGSRLSYAQGATMVDMIIASHGTGAIAEIAAAYRDGASDDEALAAGTEQSAEELYADFYAAFDVPPPDPIQPAPILPSNVRLPGGPAASGEPIPAATATPAASAQPAPQSGGDATGAVLVVVAVVAGAGVVVALFLAARRTAQPG
jgi:hypothetical protein